MNLTEEERLEIAIAALKSIACLQKPGQEEKSYWLNTPHNEVAEVAASDTIIARETLAKIGAK